MTTLLKSGKLAILVFLAIPLLSCNNFYFSGSSNRNEPGLPGQDDRYSQPDQQRYMSHSGVVQIFGSVEELKAYKYKALTTLTESNIEYNRSEKLEHLQRRAAGIGANAIAIIDEKQLDGQNVRIRVSAVQLLGRKETTN